MKIAFNRKVIKFGIYVSLVILCLGTVTLLISTISHADFKKDYKNIILATISFGYFIVLMLLTGLAAFWISLFLFNVGLNIRKKIIYYVLISPLIIALNIFFIRFTVLTILRSLKSQIGF